MPINVNDIIARGTLQEWENNTTIRNMWNDPEHRTKLVALASGTRNYNNKAVLDAYAKAHPIEQAPQQAVPRPVASPSVDKTTMSMADYMKARDQLGQNVHNPEALRLDPGSPGLVGVKVPNGTTGIDVSFNQASENYEIKFTSHPATVGVGSDKNEPRKFKAVTVQLSKEEVKAAGGIRLVTESDHGPDITCRLGGLKHGPKTHVDIRNTGTVRWNCVNMEGNHSISMKSDEQKGNLKALHDNVVKETRQRKSEYTLLQDNNDGTSTAYTPSSVPTARVPQTRQQDSGWGIGKILGMVGGGLGGFLLGSSFGGPIVGAIVALICGMFGGSLGGKAEAYVRGGSQTPTVSPLAAGTTTVPTPGTQPQQQAQAAPTNQKFEVQTVNESKVTPADALQTVTVKINGQFVVLRGNARPDADGMSVDHIGIGKNGKMPETYEFYTASQYTEKKGLVIRLKDGKLDDDLTQNEVLREGVGKIMEERKMKGLAAAANDVNLTASNSRLPTQQQEIGRTV